MFSNFKIRLSSKTLILSGSFGLVLLCASVYFGFKAIPDIVTNKIWEMKILKEGTEQWDLFMKIPFPFTFKIYIFDVQNPEEILQGAKPIVEETGPYVYKVYKWKSEIEWNSTDEISYYGFMRFEFDKQSSGKYSEDDTVTILNSPYNTILLTVEATQPTVLPLMDDVLPTVFGENDGLFIKVKVKDYLFDGLKMCVDGAKGNFAAGMVCKQIIGKLNVAKNMRLVENTILFANLFYKNNTHLGRFTIKSGIQNRMEAGTLKFYNEESFIPVWLNEKSSCNKIRGLTTIFPANIQKNMIFESFAEDICRVMSIGYVEEEKVKDILGYKFQALNDTFSSAKKENECFCINKSRTLNGDFGCLKDGLADLTTCTGGPVLMSFPHLLYAHPEYTSSVKGLEPNISKHGTYVTLEPISGTPLRLAQRIQFNMFIRPLEGVTSMENVSNALIPLLWVEESMVLEDKFIDILKNSLFRSLFIINIVKWIIVGISAAIVAISFLLFLYLQSP